MKNLYRVAAGVAACCILADCASTSGGKTAHDGADGGIESVTMEQPVGGIYGFLTLPSANGEYPTVIMSHGFMGNADNFPIYVKYFAEKGIASYCYDFRGGAPNSRSKGLTMQEMTIPTEMEDLESVIDAVSGMKGVKKDAIYLFGGSMGGLVSALVADKSEYSSRISGLVLLYPAFCVEKDWTEKFPDDNAIPNVIENFPFPGSSLGGIFVTTIKQLDTFNHIGHYAGPTLIMHGTLDDVARMEDSERAAKMYQNATLKKFEGEHHGFTPEGDTEAAKMTVQFIADGHL